MRGAGGLELLSPEGRDRHENDAGVGGATLDKLSTLHAGEVMREAALVPAHGLGESLLPQFSFAKVSDAREDAKVRAGKAGGLDDVATNAIQNVFTHHFEGVPDAEFLGRKQFGRHGEKSSSSGLT